MFVKVCVAYREAGVYKVQVNESLPAHLFESKIEKYRDVKKYGEPWVVKR